jgi:hypothetical protein
MDASFGVDQNILEVKQQIESQLVQAAGQQAAGPLAVDAFQGASNIVGVGIGVSLPPTTNRGGEVLPSGLYPGKQALNLYVVERTPVEEMKAQYEGHLKRIEAGFACVPLPGAYQSATSGSLRERLVV